jgi:hypothetical protein
LTRTHPLSLLENLSDEVAIMDILPEDRFVVFVRDAGGCGASPEAVEHEVGSCASYAEARRVQREHYAVDRPCVIRFVGLAGGGD